MFLQRFLPRTVCLLVPFSLASCLPLVLAHKVASAQSLAVVYPVDQHCPLSTPKVPVTLEIANTGMGIISR